MVIKMHPRKYFVIFLIKLEILQEI
uniref:Uncharacterized protein n=1 Tax=Arundo donax TaxID=35708 RepID=A0A0A9AWR3_ARUDO